MGEAVGMSEGLNIYDMSTGKCLASTISEGFKPQFILDGHGVWCETFLSGRKGWAIVKDIKSGLPKLESLKLMWARPEGYPWQSSCGYKVVGDGWILNTSGKRVIWLPPHFRSNAMNTIWDKADVVWDGQFLAFLHCELPDVVILELLEECTQNQLFSPSLHSALWSL
jgi:hypothetical protein